MPAAKNVGSTMRLVTPPLLDTKMLFGWRSGWRRTETWSLCLLVRDMKPSEGTSLEIFRGFLGLASRVARFLCSVGKVGIVAVHTCESILIPSQQEFERRAGSRHLSNMSSRSFAPVRVLARASVNFEFRTLARPPTKSSVRSHRELAVRSSYVHLGSI
jgi:hypothetical protein